MMAALVLPELLFPLPRVGLTSEMAAELSGVTGTVVEISYSLLVFPQWKHIT